MHENMWPSFQDEMQAVMGNFFAEKKRERCAHERTMVEGPTPTSVLALPSPSGHMSSCSSGGALRTPILDDALSPDLNGITEWIRSSF